MGELEAMAGFAGGAAGQPSWSHSPLCGGYVYPGRKPEQKFRPGGTRPTQDLHIYPPPSKGVQKACVGQTEGRVWHSQQGEPQPGEGVVDIADGGDGDGGQGAGR